MENEGEINKNLAKETDDGFSEDKLAKQFDLGVSSRRPHVSQLFAPKKKSQTVFQAQKSEEK